MAGFRLYSGNRLEDLAARLAANLTADWSDPFQPATVVMQSRGMERWLNMAVADAAGVSANLTFPFPRNFFQQFLFAPLLAASGLSETGQQRFAPEAMTWRIAALLPQLAGQAGFEPIRRYLDTADQPALKLSQLAGVIADTFDRYLLYRPQWILDWDAGGNPLARDPDSRWQRKLWRRLDAGYEAVHFAALWQRARSELLAEEEPAAGKPVDFAKLDGLRRVAFFGFSSLAPALMDLVLAVARRIDVDFYYLNPSAEFWQHNEPYRRVIRQVGREMNRLVDRAGLRAVPELDRLEAELHFETGNALLGAWGEQGREFFSLLMERDLDSSEELFQGWPEPATLLQHLQNDILSLTMPETPLPAVSRDDDSLMIHSCHGEMREVETLFENLTGLFLRHPDWQPGDVLVMMPDIEKYAPFIEAVFRSLPPEDPRWAAATVADRSSLAALPEVRVFQQLLELDRERYRVSAVLAVLDCEAVRARFGLSERDLEQVRRWLCDTAINWGVDAAYRRDCGDFEFAENSWRQGLDRMLAGFAMSTADRDAGHAAWRLPPPGRRELLPYDQIENDGEVILGRLCEFSERIFALGRRLKELEQRPSSPVEWRDLLLRTIADFLPDSAAFYEAVSALREAVSGLMDDLTAAGFALDRPLPELPLTLDLIWTRLKRRLGERSRGGFLLGGITFCEARPLRSIPAKVICLLGLDEPLFPRREPTVSFDLMRRKPHFGDRSARCDDRYLFLESLLSARCCFYLSYLGQSDKDNTPRPPSVLVSELLDYLRRYYTWQDGRELTEADLVIREPLQAFSPRYFTGTGPCRSWSADQFAVASRLAAVRSGNQPPESLSLTTPPEIESAEAGAETVITLSQLAEFFMSPAAYFCRRRLGVDLDVREAEIPEDLEKFELNSLDRFQLASALLEHHGADFRQPFSAELVQTGYEYFQQRGLLPPELSGRVAFEQFMLDFYPYAAQVAKLAGERLPPVRAAVALPGCAAALEVELTDLYRKPDDNGIVQLFYRFSSREGKEKEVIKARLTHLALNCRAVAEQLPSPCEGTVYAFKHRKETLRWASGPDNGASEQRLAGLTAWFREGQSRPLEFVPEPALKLWRKLHRDPTVAETDLWNDAAGAWSGRRGDYEVGVDPYVAFCFGDELPADAEFRRRFRDCAVGIYEQLGGE